MNFTCEESPHSITVVTEHIEPGKDLGTSF